MIARTPIVLLATTRVGLNTYAGVSRACDEATAAMVQEVPLKTTHEGLSHIFKTSARARLQRRARAAMVAEVPCNLTPRHPPSQVVDNLPRYGG